MRWIVFVCLVGCSSLYIRDGSGSGSGSQVCGDCGGINTCGFFEGEAPVSCSTPGTGCQLETWEHGCSCTCNSAGWWDCFEETVGSRCPKPPVDGGIDLRPDATPIDAAPCSRIEAENIGDRPGWTLLYGALSGGLGVTALAGQVPLRLNFIGTTFAIDHEIGPTSPSLTISIDGGEAPVVVPGYHSNFSFVSSPVASGLANIEHHVSVTCDGVGCGIDYFDVTCN